MILMLPSPRCAITTISCGPSYYTPCSTALSAYIESMSSSYKDLHMTGLGHEAVPMMTSARFAIGDIVRHKMFDFRGVIFDVDPIFSNDEEWYQSIPEDVRPSKDQPFYHLLAENGDSSYVAYVSQQNLIGDSGASPVDHPGIGDLFGEFHDGRYPLRAEHRQ